MKTKLFTLALSLFVALNVSGQNNTPPQPKPFLVLGNIPPNFKNGKVDASIVTRAELLANTTLTMPPPAFEVIGFTFSMLPKGKDFLGPYTVTGDHLTPQIVKILQGLEDPQGRIFIENIQVKVGDAIQTAQPILLNMVLNK